MDPNSNTNSYVPLKAIGNKIRFNISNKNRPKYIYLYFILRNLKNKPVLVYNEKIFDGQDNYETRMEIYTINQATNELTNIRYENLIGRIGRNVKNFTEVPPYKKDDLSYKNQNWNCFEKSVKIPVCWVNSDTAQRTIVSWKITYLAPGQSFKTKTITVEVDIYETDTADSK